MTTAPEPPDEFDTIDRLFRPLAAGAPEARGLADDVAVIASRAGSDLVVTTDAVVEGVHFLASDPLDLVARKLLRVNLSDLAAKGAKPFGYLLSITWSPRCGWPEREAFARGLKSDQDLFGVMLLGGDTTSGPGPLTASITAFGASPQGTTPSRSGARPGDLVLVSGVIGDAGLGLRVGQGKFRGGDAVDRGYLLERYRLPRPRLDLAEAVRRHATASIDVSDGLLADLAHLAEQSGVRLEIDLESLPLSPAAKRWAARASDRPKALALLASAGDDYEIAMTAPAAVAGALSEAFVAVGRVVAGTGLSVRFEGGEMEPERLGWRHR